MSAGSDGDLPADAPLGSAVVRMMLGAQLRRMREAAGLTPEAAGYRIIGVDLHETEVVADLGTADGRGHALAHHHRNHEKTEDC